MKNAPNDILSESEAQQLLETLASGLKFQQNQFTVQGLTFGRLYGRMNAIRDLIMDDAIADEPVCLCTDDRTWMAAALLASLNGGPALLIPHAFEGDTLEEARQSLPFTHALADKGRELPSGVKGWRWPETTRPSESRRSRKALSLDSAWIYLFTGGSTGTPQIWSKTPRNLLMEAVNIQQAFDIRADDTILATVPSNHIYGLLYSILLPLVSGARVSVRTPSFPNEIIQHIQETQATVLVSIPAHYRGLKEHATTDHRIRVAFSSAGALAEKDSLDFYDATGIAVTEIYGSTETGGIAQRNRANGEATLAPFGCVDVQIKENEQLRVRSTFLSNELIKNDDGFFETSDRAAWTDPSGFELLGRSDGIVKVGGKRVDLAKTRESLMQVEGVRDVYVFAVPVQSGRENEILALVEGSVTPDQIHEAANHRIPSYARPRNIRVTEQIPLSSTGKYNRNAIKKLFGSGK